MSNKIYADVELMSPVTKPKNLVNKEYVDLAVSRRIKHSVLVASFEPLDAAYDGEAQTLTMNNSGEITVGGVALDDSRIGERIIFCGQDDGTQNGIYTLTAVGTDAEAAVFTRAADWSKSSDIARNVQIPVQQGTHADCVIVLTNDEAVTLDATVLTFEILGGRNETVRKFTVDVAGDGTAGIAVSHGLGTKNVVVDVKTKNTHEPCRFGVDVKSENLIHLVSTVALETTDEFTVTVLG